MVIDVRRFGQPLFYVALEGTTPDHPEWVRRKSNVVARFHRSSYAIGLKMRAKKETLEAHQGLPLADYATRWRIVSTGCDWRGSCGKRDRLRAAASAAIMNWWWRRCALCWGATMRR